MLVLRCTNKVFKKLGIKPRASEVHTNEPTFGQWYVNTVDFLKQGHMLLACMHVPSLYMLLVPIDRKVTIEQAAQGLQTRLLTRLIELQTPPDAAKRILATYGDSVSLAKATDRKIMGHLNSALGDMEYFLGIPDMGLWDGDRLLGPCLEHRLNITPRGLSSKQYVVPLTDFWRSVRQVCPQLPPKGHLNLCCMLSKHELQHYGDVLHEHLPERLAGKLYADLQRVDVLYTINELQTLADALEQIPTLAHQLAPAMGDYLSQQVNVLIKRLAEESPTAP